MPSIKEAANEFLADKRIAVIGVSRDPKGHGSNLVYRRLRERGYEVFAINPNADEVEGDPCYHDLKTILGGSMRSSSEPDPRSPGTRSRMCGPRYQAGVDASLVRSGKCVRRGDGVRPATGHHRDRRGLRIDVRAHRRRWAQGHAHRLYADRQGSEAGVTDPSV